jgi:hypothetical protein
MTELKVVPLYESNFRDPAATLRVIADEIDDGKFGPVGCVGVVLMGNSTEVFGFGPASDAPSVAMLLHAGFLKMARVIEEHGQQSSGDDK